METNLLVVLIPSMAAIIGAAGTIIISLNKNKNDFKQQQEASLVATQLALNNQTEQLTIKLQSMLDAERLENIKLRERITLLEDKIEKLNIKLNNL